MNESLPCITIGITCFNASDTIISAIDSALAQNWPNIEILIVDDASSDSSVDVIQERIKGLSNARLIVHEVNRGVAAARNTLLSHARGEFIAFFDDDDQSHPDRVRLQYDRLMEYEAEKQQKILACYASVKRTYPNGYAPIFHAIGSQAHAPVDHDLVAYHLYLDRDPNVFYGSGTPCLSFMARTDVIRQVGGFDPALRRNEDGEFAIRLGLMGGAAIGCPEILVFQTASTGQDKRPEISLESDLYIIEKHRDILIKYGRYRYARLWAHVKYHHHAGHRILALMNFALLVVCHPVLAMSRFITRGPARLVHEWKFSRKQATS